MSLTETLHTKHSYALAEEELPPYENDPFGKSSHEPGAKLDSGKVPAAQLLGQFPLALSAILQVGAFGAKKYSMGGWKHVPNGFARYQDAQFRHWLYRASGEEHDSDSQLPHLAHEAWNALASLELYLQGNK